MLSAATAGAAVAAVVAAAGAWSLATGGTGGAAVSLDIYGCKGFVQQQKLGSESPERSQLKKCAHSPPGSGNLK